MSVHSQIITKLQHLFGYSFCSFSLDKSFYAFKALLSWTSESNLLYHDLILLPSYRKFLTGLGCNQGSWATFSVHQPLMAVAIWETVWTISWVTPTFSMNVFLWVPSICFSSSESVFTYDCSSSTIQERVEKERLTNMFPFKHVEELCLICFKNVIYDVQTDY